MHTLRKQDRDASMTNYVSFQGVPMARGLAFTIDHIEAHGARVDIFSACRIDKVIEEHNKQFGTHLHGQQFLYDHQGEPGFNPANPPSKTSHCLYADNVIGPLMKIPVGGALPWFACGIDLADRGKREDVSRFLSISRRLGYVFKQPYDSGTERHHVICVKSPIGSLVRAHIISETRSAS